MHLRPPPFVAAQTSQSTVQYGLIQMDPYTIANGTRADRIVVILEMIMRIWDIPLMKLVVPVEVAGTLAPSLPIRQWQAQ